MTEKQIESFDPSKLMDGVRDRIKSTFVSLIPDGKWDEMVKKVTDDFFKQGEKKQSYYDRKRNTVSDFETIVIEELEKLTREKIKEALVKYSVDSWGNNDVVISKELEKILIKKTPEIIASAIGQMMNGAINSMRTTNY